MRNFLCEGTHATNCTVGTFVADDGAAATTVSQGGGSNSVQFSNAFAQAFATSARFLSTAAAAGQVIRLPFTAGTVTGAVRMYHRAASLPPVNWAITTLRQASAVSSRIILHTDGSVSIASSSGTILATTAAGAWAVDRWNRIEVWFDGNGATSTHDLFLAVYDAESGTPTGTASRTNTTVTTPIVAIDIGQPVSNGAWEHWFDSVGLEVGVTDFQGPYVIPSESRDVDLSGSGTLSATATEKYLVDVSLSGSGSLAGAIVERHTASVGLSGAGALSATAEALPFLVSLSGVGLLEVKNVTSSETPPITFSYWEKRRKNFGPGGEHIADDLKPFWYQSYPQGVTLVRYADGSFAPVSVVTEELEALEGIRIFWGGKDNVVTQDEAAALAGAGYGDYLSTAITTPDDAFGAGDYGEGDYGA